MNNFLNPFKVLQRLSFKKDMTAADFGSGSGFWVLPLAKILEQGRVYAIDILEEPLSALRAKAKSEKISNIETLKADVERGVKLSNESCDLVLMTNLFFQVQDKEKVLNEGKRVLKKNGRILVVDWKVGAPLGPKEGRVHQNELMKMAEAASFEVEKEFDASLWHYGLIFKK